MALFEKAPAKINLSLDVIGKRMDGFHEVEMIMATIDLADRVELNSLNEDRIEVSLWSRYVPNDERNLAYKAAKIFKKEYGIKKGVHIKIEKNIPVSAGLGGGSSNAAAVLRGLNKLWDVGVPLEELALLGLKIDADVPFCILGKTAIARGKGEILKRLPAPPSCWVILAKPNIGVSTKSILQRVNVDAISHPNTNEIIKGLYEGDFQHICKHIGNSLECITMSLYPEVKRIKEKMINAGAEGVLMSGSGPTVYGLVKHHNKAQRIYNSMKGFCHDVHIVRIIG
ncbi:4-(cytidine 5'-diphospho)-2-C-methyl-D-erythritol kinase [Ornithinibacillus sp. L9]|uniref:4-diphosphocytidyl-2-C-methyl-D-erythritol kinase n=1 Tax=Ornithinibacillus caprae TaxID=2678566 RepID=A0A6N8FJC5_9BACI|nr:4-(cytidine 5'-diphospho)-2-C-methyl-D-erythritol kinase [Ornithinibacillus caprae]MUK88077.1 4-(cytidine 5'-diphospho)-2-C-methyl-D-erythritol kinase [Ornithinibacillus caprae]